DRLAFVPGKLAVVGPLSGDNIPKISKALQKPNAAQAVIILRQTPIPEAALLPSYYLSKMGRSRIIFSTAQVVSHLSSHPWSHVRFLQMAMLPTGSDDFIPAEFSY